MKFFRKYFELITWITALALLAVMNPTADSHYSFCLFKFIGIKYCPGCGLGHSISFLFHGNFNASLSANPFGIFAIIIIMFRIYKLSCLHIFSHFKKYNYG
jgi:hypothetical protein